MGDEKFNATVENAYLTRMRIGDSFSTNEEALRHILDDTGDGTSATKIGKSDIDNLVAGMPAYSLKAKRRDTTVGGNDAVNSYYQFNENDDIIHPINRTSGDTTGGMGRVYNETFDEQQQLLYISFGLPDFTNAATFVEKAYNTSLATLMNSGDPSTISKIGRFLGEVVGTVVLLPLLPLKYAIDLLASEASPTKYYDFKPTMALYYKMVNIVMAHIAVNLNLATTEGTNSTNGIPYLLKNHGLDILTILSRRRWYDDLGSTQMDRPRTDDLLKGLSVTGKDGKQVPYEQAAWSGIVGGAGLALTEAMRYVGFRVEKSTSSSESASNSTKEPDFLNMFNSQVSAGRERTFNMAALKETSVGKVINDVYKLVEGVAEGVTDSLHLTGGLEMLKGAGFLDVPELWNASTFTKNYSFDFQLRTPFGDPLSIFYSLYIPLSMLIAGAFPRSVGQNSYTSPFIVRAYCEGMFAIPLGIIDSISIKRGNAEYGWANASGAMLPTEIDIAFTIKDLSPIMHVALADGGVDEWMGILGQNSTFQEYMLTLSGVNIAQRTLVLERLKARAKALLTIISNNKLNPLMFGFSMGSTKLGKALSAMSPVSRLPGRVPKPQG